MKKKLVAGLATGLLLVGMVGMASADMVVSQGLGSSAYMSSGQYAGFAPELAFDGDFNNMWNSGDWPMEWLEVDLGLSFEITGIVLSVEQLPTNATTIHQIWTSDCSIAGNTSGANLSYTFSGQTIDGQLLSAAFSTPLTAQYVQIRTISSPSWVAWNEVQVLAADPVPEPATMLLFGTGLVGLAGIRRKKKT